MHVGLMLCSGSAVAVAIGIGIYMIRKGWLAYRAQRFQQSID